jgi:hypothetical protein
MRFISIAALGALAAVAAAPLAGAATPALYLHQTGFGTMPCRTANGPGCPLPPEYSAFLPGIAGAQLSIPWSAVQTGRNTLDWTQLENVIRPWVAAGKKVALSFHAVEELAGDDQTGIPATPAFILAPTDGQPAPLNVACTVVANGQKIVLPVVPVYWDPLYSGPWRAFAAAVVQHFANRPEIAYLRFGVGQGDESFIENTTPGNLPVTPVSQNACNNLWTQADQKVGKHGVFNDHLAQAQALVTYVGSVARATPGAPPLAGSYNDLGTWETQKDPKPHPFADPLAASEAAAGMMTGNEGFGNQSWNGNPYSTKFGGIYSWTDPYFGQTHAAHPWATTMQTGSPAKRSDYTALPNVLLSAMQFGIGTFEMYEKDLLVTFDPNNVTGKNPYTGPSPSPQCLSTQVLTVLAGHPIPSCH